MKVKFEAIFDLPESFATFTQDELRQTFYEEIVRTLHRAHMQEVFDYQHAAPREIGEVSATIKAAEEHALMWAGITDLPEWTVTKLAYTKMSS